MLERLTPTPEQADLIQRITTDTTPGCIVGAEIGSGKTIVTVEGTLNRFAKRVLVVAPLAVYENWESTFATQTEGAVKLLACGKSKYAGIPVKQLKANLENFMAGEDGFYFMGREFWISQDWYTSNIVGAKGQYLRKQKHPYAKHPVDVLIFDEAHFAANKQSKGFKTFKSQPAGYKVAVTGTYFGNDFSNAYTLPNAIWGEQLTDTFALWRARYAATEFSPHTYDRVAVTGELNPGAWIKELPTYLFMEGHKGEVVTESHFVDLYPSQRRVYDAMDRDYAARAESGEWILSELAATANIRLRQVSIADIDVEPGSKMKDGLMVPHDKVVFPSHAKSAKYDELKRLLNDHDEPVVVTLDFTQAAVRFVEWLNRDGISAGLWAGQQWTKDDERMRLKESFLAGDTRVLVGVPAAMGTGVDGLQKVCRRMYIVSETQNGIGKEQTIGRLDRRGQERPVYVTNLHARSTLDLGITESLAIRAINNAMSRRADNVLC